MPFATTWMDLEGIMLSKIDRERQILYYFTHMWKINKQTYRYREKIGGYQRGRELGEGERGEQAHKYGDG